MQHCFLTLKHILRYWIECPSTASDLMHAHTNLMLYSSKSLRFLPRRSYRKCQGARVLALVTPSSAGTCSVGHPMPADVSTAAASRETQQQQQNHLPQKTQAQTNIYLAHAWPRPLLPKTPETAQLYRSRTGLRLFRLMLHLFKWRASTAIEAKMRSRSR